MMRRLLLAVTALLGATSSLSSADQDPLTVAPDLYRVVFENERVRVLAFHGGPGARWGLHAHPDAVVISMSDYTVRNVVPGKDPTERSPRRGDVLWIAARSHTGENVGATDMDCLLVELKEPKL